MQDISRNFWSPSRAPGQLEALRPARPAVANQFFQGVLVEAARSGQTVAATARYFRLDR